MSFKQATPKPRAEALRSRRAANANRPRRFDAVAQGGIFDASWINHRGTPARPAAAPSPSRPVVVRNTTFGTPIHRQVATANPRRAYYVPLSAPGAEMRLPALPVIRPGWRLLSAAIAIAAAIGFFSLIFSPFFRVGPVTINGLERLNPNEVQAVLDLENLSIVEVDPTAASAGLLKRFPALQAASVSVDLPVSVTVNLTERQPVLAWQQDDNVQWVDAQGVLFAPTGQIEGLVTIHSPEAPPVAMPKADQPPAGESAGSTAADGQAESGAKLAKPTEAGPVTLDPSLLATAQMLAARLPAGTPLVFTAAQGLGWEDPTGYDIYIGSDLSSFEKRFAMVQAIVAQLTERGKSIELINAANPDAPYYRLEQ